MPKTSLLVFIAAYAGFMMALASAGGPIAPLASSLHPSVSSVELVAAKAKSRPGPTKKQKQPYCPFGKKADGSCWVRCSQVICL